MQGLKSKMQYDAQRRFYSLLLCLLESREASLVIQTASTEHIFPPHDHSLALQVT